MYSGVCEFKKEDRREEKRKVIKSGNMECIAKVKGQKPGRKGRLGGFRPKGDGIM